MRSIICSLMLLISLWRSSAAAAGGERLVEVPKVAPGVKVEMPYATADNFTGRIIYDCGRCFLDSRTAAKLALAQRYLETEGFSLKMWDCYRPLSVQKILWSIVPDSRYVADPQKGSRHNRGTAVDVTLVDLSGGEVQMPTSFDDFSPRAASSAKDVGPAAAKNREILAIAMRNAGFRPLATEWWHFDDAEVSGDLLDVPFTELCK
ncbi:M15 family metallopeptidase [Geomonas sp. RF6]|uniref:M15 family metallopeptidase n=1 Tax=Geomonas sp. RF6 TaxID=2897342 RepID=UPI001E5CD518|nr:M15 family metallopeptidase [Geomonas sp. RF6]UFS71148.1 M15 family metallopeptidase [Geomonas sp. RF6]